MEDFNNFASKDEQDSYLCGLIDICPIARKRPRKDEPEARKDHAATYSYKIRSEGIDVPICHKAFLSFHGISKNRVTRLQQSLLLTGNSPKSKQGKHNTRPRMLPDCIKYLVENHINSYQARKSHYSLRDNPHRKYLSEDLSISVMHKHFLELYRINISYKSYWSVFNTFNIHFGYPRSDTCAICDSLQQKLNAATDDESKAQYTAEQNLHLRKAEAFKTEKKKYIMKAKEGRVTCLSFDFMQNLPLPHIPSGPVYYSRQLWFHIFGVHDLSDDSVTMYRYLESEAKKGANEVTSMLLDAINNLPDNKRKDELVLISDGCPGQNKNKTMVQFLYCLVHVLKIFKRVTYLFPMRGHSYLPNDQDFGLIGNKKKKANIVTLPEHWDKVVQDARQHPSPFKLKIMTHEDFFDIRSAVEPLFLKTPKPPLKLQQVRMMLFDQHDIHVNLRKSYYGLWERHIVVNKSYKNTGNTLDIRKLYQSPPGIQPAKANNLRELIQYLENPLHRQYYESLLEGPAPNNNNQANEESNVDIDDDDNSDGCEET